MRNTARASVKLISVALAAQLALRAQAIVTRDDRDDSAFLSLGQEYAATTVMFRQASSPEEPGDAGTLIGARWVLTAAHVAAGLAPGDLVEVSGHVHTIERVVPYPEWRSNARLSRGYRARPTARAGAACGMRVISFASRGSAPPLNCRL